MTQRNKPHWQWREGWLFVTPLLAVALLFGVLQGREWWQQRQERLKHEAQEARETKKRADEAEQKLATSRLRLADALKVIKVLWSPDSQMLVSLGQKSVAVWDAGTGRLKQPLLHEHWRDITFSPDGQQLAAVVGTSSQNSHFDRYQWVIQIWNASKKGIKPEHRFTMQETDAPLCLTFSHDNTRLLVGGGGERFSKNSASRGITIYNPTDGKVRQRLVPAFYFNGAPTGVSAIATTSDDQTVVAGQQNGQLSTWHLPDGKLVSTMRPYAGGIGSLEFSPDQQTLAIASNGSDKGFWTVSSHKPVEDHHFQQYGGAMHYSPDGLTTIISGGDDSFYDPIYRFIILVPSAGTGAGHFLVDDSQNNQGRGDANDARFSPDGTRIASAHDNGILKIWDVKTGKVLMTLHHSL